MKKNSKLDTAIILVSEITKGMKSIGSKSLLPIHKDLTAIDHQIQNIKKYYSPNQIILCTGFDHIKIQIHTKEYKDIKYFFNENYEIDNQAGTLIKCIKKFKPKNTLVMTSGLLLFDKINIPQKSTTYFIDSSKDRRNHFEIGTNALNKEGYLFYGLSYKWIETIFFTQQDTESLYQTKNLHDMNKLFLFELVNSMQNEFNTIDFRSLGSQNTYPIKINSLKDMTYAKNYYKKYKLVSY